MSTIEAQVGFRGDLETEIFRAKQPMSATSLRIPGLGRLIVSRDPGEGRILSRDLFSTHLTAKHFRKGRLIEVYDLGSGVVTNVGVTALANDFNWAQNCQTLKLANYHAVGTGATAAAATDIAIQTLGNPTTTTAVAGTQSLVSAANSQTYRTVATTNFTGTVAVTEWGLFTASALSATTGTPFTATTATSATVTGTPYSASSGTVQGEQQLIVKAGTTASYGLILSNTTSVLTIPAWYKTADGTAGTTPGGTEAFTLLPVLWDHKQFAALNFVNGDSCAWTYSLAVNSGG